MIQFGISTRLSQKVIWYRLVGTLIFIIIIAIVLNFIAGKGIMNVTVNGNPTTVNTGSMGPLIVFGIPFALFCLMTLYNVLYYKMYSFVVNPDKISVTSGVIFPSTKTVDFKIMQNIATRRGPLLRVFELEILQGFTSSPGQLVISSSGRGRTNTTYRPDISIPLISADAEQLHSLISQAAEVQKGSDDLVISEADYPSTQKIQIFLLQSVGFYVRNLAGLMYLDK